MSCLPRFVLWIIRTVAFILFGICVLGAIFLPAERATCIAVGAVSFFVAVISTKGGDKLKTKSVSTCKKCGKSMSGASWGYQYRLSDAKFASNSTFVDLPVNIIIRCPHCSHEKTIYETFSFDSLESIYEEKVESKVQQYLDTWLN